MSTRKWGTRWEELCARPGRTWGLLCRDPPPRQVLKNKFAVRQQKSTFMQVKQPPHFRKRNKYLHGVRYLSRPTCFPRSGARLFRSSEGPALRMATEATARRGQASCVCPARLCSSAAGLGASPLSPATRRRPLNHRCFGDL